MKKIIIIIGIIILIVVAVSMAKQQGPKTVDAPLAQNESMDEEISGSSFEAISEGNYRVNPESSTLAWEGIGPLTKRHYGTVDVESGLLVVADNNLAGNVVFDMNTIASEQGENSMLDNDLKSSNFFEVETYPTSTFVITSYQNGEVTGDLTLRDTTNTISLPVTIEQSKEGEITLTGKTIINRLDWNIEYRSGTIFADIGDRLVKDEIPVQVKIVADLEENE